MIMSPRWGYDDVAPLGLVGCRLYEAPVPRAEPRDRYCDVASTRLLHPERSRGVRIHISQLVSASLDEQLTSDDVCTSSEDESLTDVFRW